MNSPFFEIKLDAKPPDSMWVYIKVRRYKDYTKPYYTLCAWHIAFPSIKIKSRSNQSAESNFLDELLRYWDAPPNYSSRGHLQRRLVGPAAQLL